MSRPTAPYSAADTARDAEDTERMAHDRTVPSLARPGAPAPGPRGGDPGTTTPPVTDAANTLPTGAPSAGTGAVETGMVLAGKYKLVRLLGQGGMGKVFLGEHLGLGVPIAVKVMHPEIAAATDYVRRFRHEAHAASLLNHPNVVRVFDFGEDERTLFMVMELLQGTSLGAWLGRVTTFPPVAQVADILGQLLDAFAVAHAFGIVHRDLKPENVFLTEVGGRQVVKVLDFGLAHVDDQRDQGPTLTSKDVIAGTPEYMSPEQCRSLAVGPSADIYSIGCLLTDMLQLRPPFTGSSAIEVLAKQMFSPPPPLARPADAEPVPPLLERLRLDLLAKAPEKRPRDAAEAKARLLEALSREATEARLPTRKGDEPLGDRAARAPAWGAQPGAGPGASAGAPRRVGVVRLAEAAGGVTSELEVGLAAQRIEAVSVARAEAASAGLTVLVIDAGERLAEARALLAELGGATPPVRAVVCAAHLDTERMNELVAAGAADVVRYPVTPDTLARKLDRVLRRGR